MFRDLKAWWIERTLLRRVRQGKITINQAREKLGLKPWTG